MKTEYETEYKEWKTPELSVLDIVETAGFGDDDDDDDDDRTGS